MLGHCLGGGHGCSFFSSINGGWFCFSGGLSSEVHKNFPAWIVSETTHSFVFQLFEFSRFFKPQEQPGGFSELAMRFLFLRTGWAPIVFSPYHNGRHLSSWQDDHFLFHVKRSVNVYIYIYIFNRICGSDVVRTVFISTFELLSSGHAWGLQFTGILNDSHFAKAARQAFLFANVVALVFVESSYVMFAYFLSSCITRAEERIFKTCH